MAQKGAAGAAHSEDRRNAPCAYPSFAALKAWLECHRMPAVLPFGKQRQEHCWELEASLGYRVTLCLKKRK